MTNVLPLAITMMASPQIMSAIVFVTGERDPVKVSLAFVLGVVIATTLGISIAVGLAGLLGDTLGGDSSSEPSTTARVFELSLVGLLIAATVKAYLGRETAEPPRWLGRLQGADPKRALKIGLLVILLMPSDIVIMITAAEGADLDEREELAGRHPRLPALHRAHPRLAATSSTPRPLEPLTAIWWMITTSTAKIASDQNG